MKKAIMAKFKDATITILLLGDTIWFKHPCMRHIYTEPEATMRFWKFKRNNYPYFIDMYLQLCEFVGQNLTYDELASVEEGKIISFYEDGTYEIVESW